MPFDLDALLPECLLAAGVVVLLLVRLVPGGNLLNAGWLALLLLTGVTALAGWQWTTQESPRLQFSDLLVIDRLALFFRLFLAVAATLTALLVLLTGLVRREDSATFGILLLSATLGMMVMTTSRQLPPLLGAVGLAALAGFALKGFRREGSAEVAGFLSVSVPAASFAVLARVVARAGEMESLATGLLPGLAVAAAVTATVGHLTAIGQRDAQRLLGFATIGQVGFLLMGVATLTHDGLAAVLVGLVALLVANLGAFGVLAFLREPAGSSDRADLRGLIRRAPVLTVLLAIFLLSLIGVPPLVGYFARFNLLVALADATRAHPAQAGWLYGLLIVAGVNVVLAAIAYLGLLRTLILEQRAEDLEGAEPQAIAEPAGALVYAGVLAVLLAGLFVGGGPVLDASRNAGEPGASAPDTLVTKTSGG